MQFPQDAGLSCVRYYLDTRDSELEATARSQMISRGCCVGTMVCQCKAESSWQIVHHLDLSAVELFCGCNGSSIPVYIGKPPSLRLPQSETADVLPPGVTRSCPCGKGYCHRLAIGIGYPDKVPALGTLDVERALEIVIARSCKHCSSVVIEWHHQLLEPPAIQGDEPWIRIIQGYGFGPKSRWQR